MTVTSLTSKIVYVGTGSTASSAKIFAYPFYILNQNDLTVSEYDNSTSTATVKVLDTDYSVTGVGNTNGGNVIITGSYTNVPTGSQLVIQREVDLTQETDYVENDAFPAQTHENALDKLTMGLQQLQEQLDRCVKSDITQTTSDLDVIANAMAAASSATVAVAQATLASQSAANVDFSDPTFTGTTNAVTIVGTLVSSTSLTVTNTANIGSLAGVYSEGAWAGSFLSSSGSVTIDANHSSGAYVKLGRMVSVTGEFLVTQVSSPAGELQISGLPFTCGNANKFYSGVSIYTDLLVTNNYSSVIGTVIPNTKTINIRLLSSNMTALVMANYVKSGSYFIINSTYFTA